MPRTKRKTTPVLSRTRKQTSARTVRNRGRNRGGNPASKKLLKRLAIILIPAITVALASRYEKIVSLLQELRAGPKKKIVEEAEQEHELSPQLPRSLSHNRGAPSPRSANDLFKAFKTGIRVAYEQLGGDTVFGQLIKDAYLLNLPIQTVYNGIRMKDLEYTSRSKSSSTTDVSIDVSVENLGGEQFDLSIPKGYQKTVYELKCVHEQQKGVHAYLLQYYRKDSEQPLIDNTQLTPGDSLIFLTDHYCKRIGEYKDSICFVCIQITDYWVVTFSGYQEVDWMGEGELRQFPVEKSTWSLRVEGNWREVKPGLARYHLVEWRDHLFYTVGHFIELGEIRGKQWITLNNLIYFMNNQPDSRLYVVECCDSTKYTVLSTNWVFDTKTKSYSRLVRLEPNKVDKTCTIIYSDKADSNKEDSYIEDTLQSSFFKRFLILDDVTDAYNNNNVSFWENHDRHYNVKS